MSFARGKIFLIMDLFFLPIEIETNDAFGTVTYLSKIFFLLYYVVDWTFLSITMFQFYLFTRRVISQ